MKFTKYFMPFAALALLASCANDKLDGPTGPNNNVEGDLYMTMNISMASAIGTRTATPNQGYEVGQDYENEISSALLIFAKGSETTGYKVFATSGQIPSGDILSSSTGATTTSNASYTTSFTFDRKKLAADLSVATDDSDKTEHPNATKKQTYAIFVVANPTSDIITKAAKDADVQQVFALENNDDTYWQNNEFLMSNSKIKEVTIYDDEIVEGTHTTKATAYKLGTVTIQRAMSRFDLATNSNHLKFEGEAADNSTVGPNEVPGVSIEFDAVALINMAKSANLFKVTSKAALTSPQTMAFFDERDDEESEYWVLTPDQENSYYNSLFTGVTGDPSKYTAGTQVPFENFFTSSADYTLISDLTNQDNTFEHPNHSQASQGSYHIWRYCMENTNPFLTSNQKHANSTGVIFRGILSGTKIPSEFKEEDTDKVGEAIYAYGNVVLGTAEELKTYATSPKEGNDGVYEAVRDLYSKAVKAQIEANKGEEEGEWEDEHGWKYDEEGNVVYPDGQSDEDASLADLDEALVASQFIIYRPTKITVTQEGDTQTSEEIPVYYCYYLYMNRHNDNGQNTVMGTMEFATVRNNVYKLSVNKVMNLGHPGKTEDDPFTPDPDDPNEKDEFWLDVQCEILPWEVRINDIIF